MIEIIFEELGYFSESTMKKIQNKVNGKTFMNFQVTYSNQAGNCTLIVKTDYQCASKESIKNFFYGYLINHID